MVETDSVSDSYQFIIIICIIFISILLSVSIYRYATYKCERPSVIYKFVPRTFEQEQREPLKTSIFFKNMFEDAPVNQYGISLGLKSQRVIDARVLSS